MADGTIWNEQQLRDPHAVADKQRRVRDMFAAIAASYDLNNHVHSLGIDHLWRKRAVRLSKLQPDDVVVDVACGTGDLTLAYARALLRLRGERVDGELYELDQGQVIGIDYTHEMLPIARRKSRSIPGVGNFQQPGLAVNPIRLNSYVPYLTGDAQALPLPDASCDVLSIAFGIRNVADPRAALIEFRRVLKPGGRCVILEFSKPTSRLIGAAYGFYFKQVMTRTAALVAGDKTGAYRYLSASVETFKTPGQMKTGLTDAGFTNLQAHRLTFGIAHIYVGLVTS